MNKDVKAANRSALTNVDISTQATRKLDIGLGQFTIQFILISTKIDSLEQGWPQYIHIRAI